MKKESLFKRIFKRRSKKANENVKIETKEETTEMTLEELKELENKEYLALVNERKSKLTLSKQDDINNELWLNGQGG